MFPIIFITSNLCQSDSFYIKMSAQLIGFDNIGLCMQRACKTFKLFFYEHLNFLMDYHESDKRAGVIRVVIGYQHMHVNDSLKREPDK